MKRFVSLLLIAVGLIYFFHDSSIGNVNRELWKRNRRGGNRHGGGGGGGFGSRGGSLGSEGGKSRGSHSVDSRDGGDGQSRGGCGFTKLKAFIGPYPGNTDDKTSPRGYLKVDFDKNDNMRVAYGLQKVSQCKQCAIIVHSGVSCDAVENIGEAYYGNGTSNPWDGPNASYDVYADFNNTQGQFLVNNGYNATGNNGKAVVVYGSGGEGLGCGVLNGKGRKKKGKSRYRGWQV
jgi:hypothetical protein